MSYRDSVEAARAEAETLRRELAEAKSEIERIRASHKYEIEYVDATTKEAHQWVKDTLRALVTMATVFACLSIAFVSISKDRAAVIVGIFCAVCTLAVAYLLLKTAPRRVA